MLEAVILLSLSIRLGEHRLLYIIIIRSIATFLYLPTGSSITCYCVGEAGCSTASNCTTKAVCYMRIISREASFIVSYGCYHHDYLIPPENFCDKSHSSGEETTTFKCCTDTDYCNENLTIPTKSSSSSTAILSSTNLSQTPTHSTSPQSNRIALWPLLLVTVIPVIFIINLILCTALVLQLRYYRKRYRQQQREPELHSNLTKAVKFV